MKDKKIHITSLESLLVAINQIHSPEDKQALKRYVQTLQTTNVALEGALLFLEDTNWDIALFKSTIQKNTQRLDRLSKPESKFTWLQPAMKYAAILILPLGILLSYLWITKERAINLYYVEEPGLPNFMDNLGVTKWGEPMSAFKNAEYTLALSQLNAMSKHKTNDTLCYFQAVSNYKIENYALAVNLFDVVLKNSESAFLADSEFRKAFALFNLGEKTKAKIQFNSIAQDKNHPYANEAATIIKNVF